MHTLMRQLYRVLAGLVPLLVVVQAGAIVYAISGFFIWMDQEGVVDASRLGPDGDTEFAGVGGFMVHAMNGMMLIPLVGLLLLIVSFFAKVRRGIMLAAATFGLIVVQVFLGIMGHELRISGLAHGVNALILFSVGALAFVAAHRTIRDARTVEAPELVERAAFR